MVERLFHRKIGAGRSRLGVQRASHCRPLVAPLLHRASIQLRVGM